MIYIEEDLLLVHDEDILLVQYMKHENKKYNHEHKKYNHEIRNEIMKVKVKT